MNDTERAAVISTLANSLAEALQVKDVSYYQLDEITKAITRIAKPIGSDDAAATKEAD